MKSFASEVETAGVTGRVDAGVHTVPATKIVGSVGRAQNLRSDFFYKSGKVTARFHSIGRAMQAGRLLPPVEHPRAAHRTRLGGVLLNATYERTVAPGLADGVINEAGDRPSDLTRLPAGAIVVQTGELEFVVAGIGTTIVFEPGDEGDGELGILRCDEGGFDENGEWITARRLNGDETHQGRHLRLVPGQFTIQRIALYRYR